jgi:predicted RND superfamily exporter protein
MMTQGLVRKLVVGRWWLLTVGILAFTVAWGPAQQLRFDRRIEQMFPVADPSVEAYELLRQRFGGNAVAMLVYRDEQLLTVAGIERVRAIAAEVGQIPGVKGVLSLGEVDKALADVRPMRLLGLDAPPPILGDDILARGFRELFADYTHDRRGRFAAVVAMLDPSALELHEEAIGQMRRVVDRLPDEQRPAALVGEPVLVTEGFALVEQDGQRLASMTIGLLGVATFLLFRSWRWVLAELVLILWSVVVTRGIAAALGLQLSMVSSMLTAIVTVIAVASVIHIAVQYGTRRNRGDEPRQATVRTLQRMLPQVAWACITDAVGFAALVISDVGPVRDFGLLMTLGTGVVLLGVILLLPGLILIPPQRFVMREIPLDRRLRRWLVQWLGFLQRYQGRVVIGSLIVLAVTSYGMTQLVTETNFIRNFRQSGELASGYRMVESELGGAGVWDVLLPTPPQLTGEYLESVRVLQERLRKIGASAGDNPGDNIAADDEAMAGRLTKVLSMADADGVAAQSPLLALAPPTVRIAGMRVAMPAFVDALISDQRLLRIMLRSPERLSAVEKMELIDAVEGIVAEHTGSEQWRRLVNGEEAGGAESIAVTGRVTGYYVLLARLIESLLADQWLCLAAATGAVFLAIACAYRSLWLAFLCLIPNVLPVLAVLGSLGLLGVRVNMGAAMIAAVSVGLTIDGSIHFLAGYRHARRRETNVRRAVLHAQRRVGLPVLLATISLAIGFSVLASSAFIPTVTFGLLVTAALAAGTLANLSLLPLLVLISDRNKLDR